MALALAEENEEDEAMGAGADSTSGSPWRVDAEEDVPDPWARGMGPRVQTIVSSCNE